MNNLHLSLTNLKNESRLLKETKTIAENNICRKVFIAGLWEEGLSEHETLDENRELQRVVLKSRDLPKNLFFQLLKYFELTWQLLFSYKNQKITMVNIHSIGLLPIGVLFKLFYGSTLIYDAHEYETELRGLYGLRKRLAKILEKSLIRFCDRVIVVSHAIADEYDRLYPNIKRPAVILNCPPYREIVKRDLFRERWGIAPEATIFLYQGGFGKGRSIEVLIETFAALEKDKIIVFMGYGPLETVVDEASETYENIFYHPAVSPNELLEYTSSADIGFSIIEDCCLSYRYCLPNKLFEYAMAGVPVIVSDLPEMRRVVEQYNVGVVAESITPEGITNAIVQLIQYSPEDLQKNLSRLKHKYNWEIQEVHLLQLYRKLYAD